MTQFSMPWNNIAVGDGQTYTWDEWHEMLDALLVLDNTSQGVLVGHGAELIVTTPAINQVNVGTGIAIVKGRMYENDATKNITGLTSGTSGRIVLQQVWASQTIRAVQRASGALVQTNGVQWEIPLASYDVSGGGVVTLYDERFFANSPLSVGGKQGLPFRLIARYYGGKIGGLSTFTMDIPQVYKHLYIEGVTITDYAGSSAEGLLMRFNGDTGANYNYIELRGQNVSHTSTVGYGQTSILTGTMPTTASTTFPLGSFEMWLPNYRNTDMWKTTLVKNGSVGALAVGAFYQMRWTAGNWQNTNPIQQITFVNGNGGLYLSRMTEFRLYGLGG